MKNNLALLIAVFSFSTIHSVHAGQWELFDPAKLGGKPINIRRYPHSEERVVLRRPFVHRAVAPATDHFVDQGQVAILDPSSSNIRSIFTSNLCPCIAVMIRNRENGCALLAHVGARNDLDTLIPFYERLGINNVGQVEVTLYTHQATFTGVPLETDQLLSDQIRRLEGIDRDGNIFHADVRTFFDNAALRTTIPLDGQYFQTVAMLRQFAGTIRSEEDAEEYAIHFRRARYFVLRTRGEVERQRRLSILETRAGLWRLHEAALPAQANVLALNTIGVDDNPIPPTRVEPNIIGGTGDERENGAPLGDAVANGIAHDAPSAMFDPSDMTAVRMLLFVIVFLGLIGISN